MTYPPMLAESGGRPFTDPAWPGRHVIDGEACVLDDIGRSDFNRLHARAARRSWYKGCDPVTFCAFDILVHDGKDVTARPLIERKALLTKAPGAL